jgi:uroporphyrin-III C-methyltransferase
MGVGTLAVICAKLIEHGLPSTTPAAIVERATLPDQRSIVGTLQTLPALALTHRVNPPALIMVGETVALHARIGAQALLSNVAAEPARARVA